jgi:hypothetical protein
MHTQDEARKEKWKKGGGGTLNRVESMAMAMEDRIEGKCL